MSGPTKKDRAKRDGIWLSCQHESCRATARATLVGGERHGQHVCIRHAVYWERRGQPWNPW